jgi:hypothetical protein
MNNTMNYTRIIDTSGTRIGMFALALTALTLAAAPTANVEAAMVGDPTGFAIYSGGHVSTQNNVQVDGSIGGGSAWFGNNAHISGEVMTGANLGGGQNVTVSGSLYAGAALSMGNKATVGGTAHYGTGYWFGNNATITGGLSQMDASDIWTPAPLPDFDMLAPGSTAQWFANNSNVDLAPGAYAGLSTGNNATLNLITGEYSFESMWLAQNVDFNIDTSGGDVVIYVAGNFSAGNNVAITASGGGNVTLVAEGSIWLAQNTTSQANFISTGSTIGLGAGAQVEGVLWAAGDISLGSNAKVLAADGFAYMNSFGGGTGGGAAMVIPEPATAALLMVGLGMILDRRPRRPKASG